MRRSAHVMVALLTFTIGVVVATVGPGVFPRIARLIVPHSSNQIRQVACNEWEKTGPLRDGLGWDLTYMPLLKSSGVCPGDLFCQIVEIKSQPPVNKFFAEWQHEPIVSSILVELPDGHADMAAIWLVRTKQQAYWWTFHPHRPNPEGMQPLPAQDYDRVFETMTCWRPHDPPSRKFGNEQGDGYIGFLSLYKEGRSRQMLLTLKDLFETWPTSSEIPDEATWGRLWKTLKPIYSTIRAQEQKKN